MKLTITTHILLGTRALVGTPSGRKQFDFSEHLVSKNSAQIQKFTPLALQRGKLGSL